MDPHPGPPESAAALPTPHRFAIGESVCLAQPLRYLKTAEPMPMLRPPDLVESGEVGTVSEIRSRDQLAVRFRRGSFLIAARDLRPARPEGMAG